MAPEPIFHERTHSRWMFGGPGPCRTLDISDVRGVGDPIGRETDGQADLVVRIALATRRRHGASPLTGTPGFWERIARVALAEFVTRHPMAVPTPDIVATVARSIAPAFSGSPVINSDLVWHGIVSTVLNEYVTPSGRGDSIPFLSMRTRDVAGASTR